MVIASRGRRCTFKDVTATDDHRPMTTKELLALLAYNDREDDPEVYEDWDDWNDGKYTYQTVQSLRQQLPSRFNVIDYLSHNYLKTNINPLAPRGDGDE